MEKTTSECLFERFCQENSLDFVAVGTQVNNRTPDYHVLRGGYRVVVEVKELQINTADEAALEEAATQGGAAAWFDPHKRIRRAIQSAYGQLERRGKDHPTLIVLFDNGTFGGIDATDIKNAMYGHETIDAFRSSDDDTRIVPYLGGGRSCTPASSRRLSAVGLLRVSGDSLRLSIFHNIFATCPLPFEWFRMHACRQFSMDLSSRGSSGFPEWLEV